MGSYFKPWRRKIGVLTLVLACLFMAGWVRGLSNLDQLFYVADAQNLQVIFSCPKGIGWKRFRELKAKPIVGLPVGWLSLESLDPRLGSNGVYPPGVSSERPRYLQWLGLYLEHYFSESPTSLIEHRVWIFSYWSVVVPLTLFTAWLLLSKSRQPQSQTPVQYTPETAA